MRCSTPFVEPPVAAIDAAAFSNDSFVTMRARRHVVADELHCEPARPRSRFLLRAVERGDAVRAEGREPEELERRRHRVRRELAAAGAGSRARDRLELVEVGVADLAGGVRADPLVDVLDRDVLAAVDARGRSSRCRDERRDVEPAERHRRRRDRLVAGDEQTRPSKRWPRATSSIESAITSRETSDARIPDVPIETPSETAIVLNSIGVAARLADPALDVPREVALVEVARHRLDPRRADADDRLREVVVGEAGGLQHRARARAVGAVGERGAVALRGIGRGVVRRRHAVVPLSIGFDGSRHHSLNEPG